MKTSIFTCAGIVAIAVIATAGCGDDDGAPGTLTVTVYGEEFIERVRLETGLKFDLITPREEARLATLGCLNLIDRSMEVCLVVDIGGGSTELSFIDAAAFTRREKDKRFPPPPIRAWSTTPVGVVTLAERHPETEPRPDWFDGMKASVHDQLADISGVEQFRSAFERGKAQIIGTSGTVTSIAGVHLKLPYYERSKVDGLWISRDEAKGAIGRLLSQTPKERALEPCIGPERADLVLAGCAIFDAIMEQWPAERMRVADRGLREGVLFNLMGRHKVRRRRRRRGGKGQAQKEAS